MENQPATTGRQWFRLASLARLEALGQPTTVAPALAPAAAPLATPAGPVQAPVPRIPIPRSETMQPQPQPPRPPTPPTQQVPRPTVEAQPQTPRGPEATPPPSSAAESSSKAPVAQALSQAPTAAQIANTSPSTAAEPPTMRQLKPIKAPTPYPEPEQAPSPAALTPKNMYVQQEINNIGGVKNIPDISSGNPHANSNQSRSNARPLPPSLEKEAAPPNGTELATAMKEEEDGAIKVITMSGENMGAYMELGSAHGPKQQHGYKLRDLTKGSESRGEDGKSGYRKRENGKKSAGKGKPTTALVSSNVQSVNNSILFRSSCAQHSPGIHMTLVSRR